MTEIRKTPENRNEIKLSRLTTEKYAGCTIHIAWDLRKKLAAMIEDRGTQKAVADELGISTSWLNDILIGRGDVANLADKLGLERVTVFVERPMAGKVDTLDPYRPSDEAGAWSEPPDSMAMA